MLCTVTSLLANASGSTAGYGFSAHALSRYATRLYVLEASDSNLWETLPNTQLLPSILMRQGKKTHASSLSAWCTPSLPRVFFMSLPSSKNYFPVFYVKGFCSLWTQPCPTLSGLLVQFSRCSLSSCFYLRAITHSSLPAYKWQIPPFSHVYALTSKSTD